ncbi:E3 ubiquitin ligase TRAF3IP2 [Sardina pilchardus]|uniref:E3 ubiquitin ligase TRAF3IP2 n=1 Tax=Sardina pilchardus TaxID=27697 RepID=UPI002E10C8D9
MESFPVPCGHRSLPVEMDESMTSSSLNLAWSACQQCLTPGQPSHAPQIPDEWSPPPVTINECGVDYPDENWGEPSSRETQSPIPRHELSMDLSSAPGVPDIISWMDKVPQKDSPVRSYYRPPKDPPSLDPGSLEPPQSLHSDPDPLCLRPMRCALPCCSNPIPPPRHPVYAGNRFTRPCPCLHPVDPARQHFCPNTEPVQDPLQQPKLNKNTTPVREVMTELCPTPSLPPAPGHIPAQEMKKTISLPDNCRNLFITYSIDTADEIPPFVTFLRTQGFRPAIDIFDEPVRRLDINKWMDSYLKDKSVLIIMVISPKYKIDIEGDGSDEHGLHTKYIHSQLQNEFIQQRCLNFRLVPVLFSRATRDHIPIWLQSTRIYRWPQDMQDLLLRLLREERYVAPPMGKELTLTIRPI